MTQEILETLLGKSIQLEPLNEQHRNGLRCAANDERIWSYMPMKAHGEFFDIWFQECLSKHTMGKQLTYVIRRLEGSLIVGSRSYYDIDFQNKRLEIGFGWLATNAWGTRINHESLWLMFRHAFESLHLNRVQISCDPRNKRSYNTLKKLGVTEEGNLRQHMIHHNGLITDTVIFSMLAHEWPNVKDTLWRRLNLNRA